MHFSSVGKIPRTCWEDTQGAHWCGYERLQGFGQASTHECCYQRIRTALSNRPDWRGQKNGWKGGDYRGDVHTSSYYHHCTSVLYFSTWVITYPSFCLVPPLFGLHLSFCSSILTQTIGEDCFERAEEFIPERWSSRPDMTRNVAAFTPFGSGKYSWWLLVGRLRKKLLPQQHGRTI